MTTHTNGTDMPATITRDDLPGDVAATLVTIADATGTTNAVQLTAPDEPLDATTLRDLAAALADTADALDGLARR